MVPDQMKDAERSTDMTGLVARIRRTTEGGDIGASLRELWAEVRAASPESAVSLWTACADVLRAEHGDESFARAILQLVESVGPIAELPPAERQAFVAAFRTLTRVIARTAAMDGLVRAVGAFAVDNAGTPVEVMVDAWAAVLRDEPQAALTALERPDLPQHDDEAGVDLRGEVGLLLHHLRRFGPALEHLGSTRLSSHRTAPAYERAVGELRQVVEFCGVEAAPHFHPECVIDVIVDELARDGPLGYTPARGRVAVVAASLAAGGGERQVVSTVRWLLGREEVSDVRFLVRSLNPAKGHDLLLPMLGDAHPHMRVFGAAPDDDADTPALALRPRLRQAISLLPTSFRAEVVRLLRELLDFRPAAVHVSQDNYYAALAGAIAGVPRLILRRGSLAPPFWRGTKVQQDTHFRPMRHTYLRLVEQGRLHLLNNSALGTQTDQAWLGPLGTARFGTIRNGVDFDLLDRSAPDHTDRRDMLGIPPDAPVLGGAFRLEPVKRPLLWADIAGRVASSIPEAHVVVIGDGTLRDDMVQIARAHGLGERLHLVGHQTDVAAWYRTMDLIMLTSEREGTPNVLIEAMHFGVPAIGSDVGGLAEVIGPGGDVLPADAPAEAYAGVVTARLRDARWLRATGSIARDHVHALFDIRHALHPLLEHYGIERTHP